VLRPPVESGHYTSAQYANLASDLGVTLSVGRKGQCWDNAVAESFFATMKTELIHRRAWPTRKTASSSSTTSRAGTTPADATPPSATSAPTQYESTITATTEQIA
jgi:transposase InsO family protein